MRLILALLLLMLAASPALAQDADQTQRLAEARQLVTMVTGNDQLNRIVDALEPTMLAQLKQQHGIMLTDTAQAGIKQVMADELKQVINASLDDLAAAYARVFSLDDLKQIIVFYGSDVGKRMLVAQPELMKAYLPELQARIQADMPTLKAKIAGVFNLPAPVTD
jgi:hypothetical protein